MSVLNRRRPERHASIFDSEQVPSRAEEQAIQQCCSESTRTAAVDLDHAPATPSPGFLYSDLELVSHEGIQISYTVRNTGWEAATESVQIYARTPDYDERLVGWERITLKPGQQQKVIVRVDMRLLAKFDVTTEYWRILGDTCELRIANFSDNKRFAIAQLPKISAKL